MLDNNSKFYNIANKEYKIPGLDTSFSSQGLYKINDIILFSGYMSDGCPSRIYMINKDNETKCFSLKYKDKNFYGHAGGIASDGINVWIASDKKVYNFSYNKLLTSENTIELEHEFDANNGADFLTIEDDYLWVGEFYKKMFMKRMKHIILRIIMQ